MEIEKEHLLASKRYRERLSRKQSRDSYLVRRFKDFFPFFLLKFAYEESVERSIERERERGRKREKKEKEPLRRPTVFLRAIYIPRDVTARRLLKYSNPEKQRRKKAAGV